MRENYINGFPVTIDTGGIDNVSGTLPVTAVASATGGFRILVESEKMLVTSGGTTTSWTVTRGIEGTTAASHTAGTLIYVILTAGSLDQIRQDISGYGSALPSSGMKRGDQYVLSTTNMPYIYTGSAWQEYGLNLADAPPASPTTYDDEFNGVTLDPKWLYYNPSSVAGTNYSTYLNMSNYSVDVTNSTVQARFLSWVQPAPSGSYTFRAKMSFDCGTWNYFGFGILAHNQSNGKDVWGGLLMHSTYGQPTTYFQRCSGGTFASDVDCYDFRQMSAYLQMSYDGSSNMVWSVSCTGAKYTKFYTETTANYLSAAPTHIGFTLHPWGDSSTNPQLGMCMSIDWFRRIA
jgi:hypothetical protein